MRADPAPALLYSEPGGSAPSDSDEPDNVRGCLWTVDAKREQSNCETGETLYSQIVVVEQREQTNSERSNHHEVRLLNLSPS